MHSQHPLLQSESSRNECFRVVHRDLFGRDEHLRLRASYGGGFRQIYAAKLDTGTRFGNVTVRKPSAS